MMYDQVYQMGFDAAIMGCTNLDDCPFDRDKERAFVSAWVFGFTEGIRYLYTQDLFEPE